MQGNLHALAVQQALGQVKGTLRGVLVRFHPNPQFPVLHHRGGHRNQHRHGGDDHRGEHQEQRREEQQHRPVEGRHLLPQFCHDVPRHPLKRQQAPDGEPNFRQVVLGEPHFQQGGGVQGCDEVGGGLWFFRGVGLRVPGGLKQTAAQGMGVVPRQGVDDQFASRGPRRVDFQAAHLEQTLQQVLFDVDGLHAVQRDVHLVSDQHALPDMELVGFQVKCEAGEVQHRAQKGQGTPCPDGPDEKPSVPVALEVKGHEDRPRGAHQGLGLPTNQNQQPECVLPLGTVKHLGWLQAVVGCFAQSRGAVLGC